MCRIERTTYRYSDGTTETIERPKFCIRSNGEDICSNTRVEDKGDVRVKEAGPSPPFLSTDSVPSPASASLPSTPVGATAMPPTYEIRQPSHSRSGSSHDTQTRRTKYYELKDLFKGKGKTRGRGISNASSGDRVVVVEEDRHLRSSGYDVPPSSLPSARHPIPPSLASVPDPRRPQPIPRPAPVSESNPQSYGAPQSRRQSISIVQEDRQSTAPSITPDTPTRVVRPPWEQRTSPRTDRFGTSTNPHARRVSFSEEDRRDALRESERNNREERRQRNEQHRRQVEADRRFAETLQAEENRYADEDYQASIERERLSRSEIRRPAYSSAESSSQGESRGRRTDYSTVHPRNSSTEANVGMSSDEERRRRSHKPEESRRKTWDAQDKLRRAEQRYEETVAERERAQREYFDSRREAIYRERPSGESHRRSGERSRPTTSSTNDTPRSPALRRISGHSFLGRRSTTTERNTAANRAEVHHPRQPEAETLRQRGERVIAQEGARQAARELQDSLGLDSVQGYDYERPSTSGLSRRGTVSGERPGTGSSRRRPRWGGLGDVLPKFNR